MVDDFSQSQHLAGTKWRGTWRGVHIDLYAPFQSRLGANLQLRIEALIAYAETVGRPAVAERARTWRPRSRPYWTGPTACPAPRTVKSCTPSWPCPAPGRGRPNQGCFAAHPGPGCCADRAGVRFMAGEPSLNRQDRARLRQMAGQWQMAMGPTAAKDLSGLSTDRGVDL